MFAIGFAPLPNPRQSLLTPTMPVIAPPKGSNAEGVLCVSTLWHTIQSLLNSIPPALSVKREIQKLSFLSFIIFSVAPLIYFLNIPSLISSISAENILCLQCSDQVCAIVSISTSEGFRFVFLK